MSNYKIIFTGPVGAGKTTAIGSLSDIPVVGTDESASDMTINRKQTTTVAMDYGLMKLEGGERIHLYGTPGQERFNFMWNILTQGGIGLILLLDNTRADPFQDMRFFLTAFDEFISRTTLAIGVTRMGEKLVFWRDDRGRLSCLRDRCVHRGVQLCKGRVVSNGRLLTPRLDRCGVRGVLRAQVLQAFKSRCEQRRLTLDMLPEADELFLCSTVRGIVPVRRVDHWEFDVGPVTSEVMRWHEEVLET